MLALLLTCILPPQDPAPAPTPSPAAPPAAAPAEPPKVVEPWDDKTAKLAADELAKLLKGTPTMAEKNQMLERLSTGSNKLLLKPLAQIVENDKSIVIRKRAAELIANQPAADANGQIRRLLKSPRVGSHPAVMGTLVRGLARCGYVSQQWSEISDLFEREYQLDRVPVQEAVLDLVTQHKEKQAIPLLLRNFDEPIPENVDSASNPPAEYWEARWKSWAIWKGKVGDALFAITGQRFSKAAEAEAWLRQNRLK
ncbi:MAG TPA: hypothetical protein VF384_19195 [Planctomycetota bacterium]